MECQKRQSIQLIIHFFIRILYKESLYPFSLFFVIISVFKSFKFLEWMSLNLYYRTVHNMCSQPYPYDYSEQLYDRYRSAFVEYIESSVSEFYICAFVNMTLLSILLLYIPDLLIIYDNLVILLASLHARFQLLWLLDSSFLG